MLRALFSVLLVTFLLASPELQAGGFCGCEVRSDCKNNSKPQGELGFIRWECNEGICEALYGDPSNPKGVPCGSPSKPDEVKAAPDWVKDFYSTCKCGGSIKCSGYEEMPEG